MGQDELSLSQESSDLTRLIREHAEAEVILQAHIVEKAEALIDKHEPSELLQSTQLQLMESEDGQRKQAVIQSAILDAISSHIALVDAEGLILSVNLAWQRYASSSLQQIPSFSLGQNYLFVCDQSHGQDAADAHAAADGLRRVLRGDLLAFTREFSSHTATETKWYLLTITPLSTEQRNGAVIAHTDISERKAAELALHASEDHFRATFERVAVGVAHVDADGHFTRVNDRLCAIIGYDRADLLKLGISDLNYPEDRKAAEAAHGAMLTGTHLSCTDERRYCRKDNTSIWITMVSTLIRDDEDEPPYFIMVIEDITLRRIAELRLHRLNRLYVVLSKVGETILRTHEPRQLYESVCAILVNDGLLRMAFVVENDAIAGTQIPVAVSGDVCIDMPQFVHAMDDQKQGSINRVLATGAHDVCKNIADDPRMGPWQPIATTHGFRATAAFPLNQDGATIAALILLADDIDYFHDDEIALVDAVANDVSFAMEGMRKEQQRLAGEASLQDSERRFRALIEHSTDALMLTDATDRILYASPAVSAIEGHGPEELIGRTGLEHTHPDDVPLIQGILAELVNRPGKSMEVVWRRIHKDGQDLWLEGVATNLLDDSGVRAIVTNYRNVTDRKRIEVEMGNRQSLLRMASRLSHIGGWTIDVPTRHLIWSEEMRDILEFPPGFLPILDDALELIPPRFRTIITEALAACINDGMPFDEEIQIITATGRHLWVRAIGEAVRSGEGRITRIQGAFQDISERRLAAEESQLVADRLITTLESVTDSFVTLDREWRFTYVNRQAELVFKRKRADLLGKRFWDEFPEDQDTLFHSEYLRSMSENVAVHIEAYSPLFHAWLEARAFPSALGLAIYFRDVSEQRKSHDKLFASEERYRLLAKATKDAIWDFDAATDHVTWNDGFEVVFGYSPSDLEATMASWTDRIHPDDHGRVDERLQAAIARGDEVWSDDFRFRRKDSSYAYVLNRCHIIRDPDGRLTRIIGGMTDLTNSRKAATQIAEQGALLDEARDAILVRDLSHNITYWNKSAERLYGWTSNEILGKSARDLLYRDAAPFDKAVVAVSENGEWVGELSPTTKDGRQLLIEARWTLVREEGGRPPSVLDISTDITDRRKLEQQFLRAQRMESIGTLAGGIAHDLNNMLAPIMLSIYMLKKDEKDERRLAILAIIDSSAKRGSDMIRQVLTFARGVEGRRLPVQIMGLLQEIESIINETFLKNIQAVIVCRPDVWTVAGDSTQLHQVLLNLCVNARDAMPDGGILTLSAENITLDEHFAALHVEARPGPYVVIGVEDTGTGIPPEIIEKIFEPFFTTKEIGKGTGLGLSTSLAVIKSHGGFLRVYSEMGKGTHFKLYIPAMNSGESSTIMEGEAASLPPRAGRADHGDR